MDGNQAVVKGAIDAGCDFFAGYPITPATSILLGMFNELAPMGGTVIQGEDEISSIGFCIGASSAGKKVMTATSGPGLSLYSENIGFALMAEVPMVIVVVQRMGPSTGSATKVAQGDVQFARWGTSGGLPMVVLAPSNVEETYNLTVQAFNIAESLRTPVILLTDKETALTKRRVDLDRLLCPNLLERPSCTSRGDFKPYRFSTPDEIPEFSRFGGEKVVRLSTSSHDEGGYICKDPDTICKFIYHLKDKIDNRKEKLEFVQKDIQDDAELLIISYGVTANSCREAVAEARKAGKKVSHLILNTLWPLPETAIKEAGAHHKRILVPELNVGLYIREIERLLCGFDIFGLNRNDTELLTKEDILTEVNRYA